MREIDMRRFDVPGRSQVFAEHGMVAASHPLAASSALQILQEGGSAVDAALSAAFVLGVVEPQMTGIGGDCFAIIHDGQDGSIHAINGSGRSSQDADLNWYLEQGFSQIPKHSAHAVTVPGALKAFDAMHQKFGQLEWARLVQDAIKFAKEGFALTPRVAFDWHKNETSLKQDEGAARHLLFDGVAPNIGDRIQFPALGKSLQKIADEGISAFYDGKIAGEIESVIKANGGFLSTSDLADVSVDWVKPMSCTYGDYELLEIPPNGQGLVTLIMLNILEELNVKSYPHDSAERYHLEIEAGRRAYAVRDAMIADGAHMTASAEALIDKNYAKDLASDISILTRNDNILLPEIPSSDTVYLTVGDKNGQIISLIYSIYSDFGSQIVTPKSGIVLQNRGACFNLEPGHPNALGPSKRPLHTIIPAMVLKDGQPVISFGVMGGAYQPMGQVHVFSNLVSYGFDPQYALDHPRLFWAEDGVIEYEAGISRATLGGLEARGHQLRPALYPIGGGQIIQKTASGFYCAGSDGRKDGLAIGY